MHLLSAVCSCYTRMVTYVLNVPGSFPLCQTIERSVLMNKNSGHLSSYQGDLDINFHTPFSCMRPIH